MENCHLKAEFNMVAIATPHAAFSCFFMLLPHCSLVLSLKRKENVAVDIFPEFVM